MVGPRDMSPAELERYGLAVIERGASDGEPIIRVYCNRCGRQVASERSDEDPDGWWACSRGCNTLYAPAKLKSTISPRP